MTRSGCKVSIKSGFAVQANGLLTPDNGTVQFATPFRYAQGDQCAGFDP